MSITFNSTGGFLNGTISSSNGDLFITTSGSVGKITLGNTEYTGSEVIEKDASGNVRNKKIFNSDGTITQQKFDSSGRTSETKIKDPSSGKEFVRSGSSTDNQIEFQQSSTGAFITVSGSSPGYNIIETSGDKDFRLIRAISDFMIKDNIHSFSVGINSSNEYEISATQPFTGNGLKVQSSGDVVVSGGITATSLNVTHFTSSFVTSSTITTEGNTIFGDTDSDSHTFNGHVTASGNISASGNLIVNKAFTADTIDLTTNNTSIRGTETGGTARNMLRMTDDDDIVFGNSTSPNRFLSNITASGNISGSSTSTINVGGNITTNDSFLGQKLILGTVDATDNTYLSASDGNVIIAGDNGSSGDVSLTIQNTDQSTSTGQTTTLQFMQQAQNAGKIVGGKDNVFVFGSAQNDSNMQFHTTLNGTDTERMRITSAGLVGIGNSSPTKTLTVEGDISSSGDVFAHSGSFNYITASIVDVDGDTIRFGGEPFTKANIQTLKLGRSLKPPRAGRTKPDIDGDDGVFDGNITSSGNISASGNIISNDVNVFGDLDIEGNHFTDVSGDHFRIGSGKNIKLISNVTASGDISASGTITGNEFIGGTIQNTGSYDFPGAIVGYNVQGLNVGHATYTLTTTMAVPDAGMNVCFVAPKSGIVEIEVQVLADGGSSGFGDFVVGLSDNATYNAVQTYYEQNVIGFPRFDHVNLVHKWIVPSLTPGTTYKYWLGAKTTNTSGTPFLAWGGNSSGRFSDFIMKATALPSNTEIET